MLLGEKAGLVQRLRGDPEASEDEHLQIILVQTEVERVRFIVRSYMRTRIHKVCGVFFGLIFCFQSRILHVKLLHRSKRTRIIFLKILIYRCDSPLWS